MNQYCVGIDVGGTTVKCGIFTIGGLLMEKWEVPTRKEEDGKNILPDVAESLKQHLADRKIDLTDVEGIGIGVPGPVEPDGYVHICVNLGWKDHRPAKEMQELMGGKIRCAVGNDANVAALGEMWQGGGKGHDNMLMVTLGTGVGGGLILNKHIVAGVHGAGAEIGHMHVREGEQETCNCGGHGCLEQVASATGIVREAKRVLAANADASTMRDYGDALTAKDVCDCAKAGDALAEKALRTAMHYLGLALAHVSMVADPELYVIGGGVSRAGQYLIDLVQDEYAALTPLLNRKAEITLATLGNDAGIYGSARLVLGNE
jgi:glucokinase